jgi:hypothetical protein
MVLIKSNKAPLKTTSIRIAHVEDIIDKYFPDTKEEVWDAITSSSYSFGTNADTLMTAEDFISIIEEADIQVDEAMAGELYILVNTNKYFYISLGA